MTLDIAPLYEETSSQKGSGKELSMGWVDPWVGLGWVEIFQFLVGWVGSTTAKVLKICMAADITLLNYCTCILCVYSIIVYCPAWQMLLIVLCSVCLQW